jgi:ketosteroid isomerase-like protein
MKRSLSCCLMGLVLLAGLAWSQAKKGGSAEREVTALEHKWLDSQKTNNPEMIAPYLSDKMAFTSSEGMLTDKAGLLKMAKDTKYTAADYKDFKVTPFGDTAIATGIFVSKGTDAGKPFDTQERFTDTWVKSGGKWQCVATHATTVK